MAVPTEHGAWGFWFEPTVLALLVVPSLAGVLLALAGLVGVFAQHPLTLVLADAARGRSYPRTGVALRVLGAYALLGVLLALPAIALGSTLALLPLVLAAPLVIVQLGFERRNRGRELVPELSGALTLAALAPVIVLAGGADPLLALALWALLVGRNVPTVLFVRARLRLDRARAQSSTASSAAPPVRRGATDSPWAAAAALASTAAAATIAVVAVAVDLAPQATAVVFVAFLLRAAHGLSRWRGTAGAKAVGIRELLYGAGAALLLGLAWGPWAG